MAYFLFAKAILEGKPIKVFNHGQMKRDFTYIDDIVEGLLRLLDKTAAASPPGGAPYRVFNIGNENPVPLLEFIQIIERQLGREAEKVWLPMQDGDVPATYESTGQLQCWIKYRPDTALDVGIKRFADWYNNEMMAFGPEAAECERRAV